MNIIQVARFTQMTDTLVAQPAKYAEILGSFWTPDSEVRDYVVALTNGFTTVSAAALSDVSESNRLATLDSIESALQGRGAGYDMAVAEMLGWAVARRRIAMKKKH